MQLDGTGEGTGEMVLVVLMVDAALVAVVVDVIKVVAVRESELESYME